MPMIATLTVNPSIDGSSVAEEVRHTHKVRTTDERFAPGGGGINVARVLARLGSDVEALYLAGGVTGSVLAGLLERAGLRHACIPISGDTRISLAVHEKCSGKEYRFVPQGPAITEAECDACLAAVRASDCSWLVISGSLPRGVPEGFYGRIIDAARERDVKIVLDTSGAALKATLAHGGVHLVKPSLGEMEQLAGRSLREPGALAAAAAEIVAGGGAEMVAVSLGHEGAMLVRAGGVLSLPAIPVQARSAVGAGDSFVAAMTCGLAMGRDPEDAFRLGIAAGTATVLTPGTDLCHRRDVDRFALSLGVAGFGATASGR
jgi:6-phosphofructokinase 2